MVFPPSKDEFQISKKGGRQSIEQTLTGDRGGLSAAGFQGGKQNE